MTWNYRVVKKRQTMFPGSEKEFTHEWVDPHEVYYDDDGMPTAMTTDPIIGGESMDELRKNLNLMLKDLNRPMFVPPESWKIEDAVID